MGEIIWRKSALNDFIKNLDFIEKKNPLNAIKVRNIVFDEIDLLLINPKAHLFDKDKRNNNGKYRVLRIYEYKISYKIVNEDIQILRFRHMKQKEKPF